MRFSFKITKAKIIAILSGLLTLIPSLIVYAASNCGAGELCNPLAVDSICELVDLLLKAAVAIGIPIAVLFIVYAGFKFIMARGSAGEITEARANLFNVIIGIAIFLGASLIAEVIINTLKQLGVNGIAAC